MGTRAGRSAVEDLEDIAESAATLTAKLQRTPGLAEGHVERLCAAIEKILKDYGGASYRHYRFLVRDCDAVAAEVAKLGKAGSLHPKVTKLLDLALLKIKKRDLYSGRQLVGKLSKLRALAAERNDLLARYREGYKGIEREAARLRAERDRLRAVPLPPAPEDAVARAREALDAANRALNRAILSELHEVPSRLALRALLEVSGDTRLHLPRPAPEEAATLLGVLDAPDPVGQTFGARGVHGLLEALGYSDAKLAHLVGEGRPLKAALNANLPWLKALTAPGHLAPALALEDPPEETRDRVAALAGFAERLHGAGDARERVAAVARLVDLGELGKAREADRIFKAHGDAARKRLAGTLDADVKKIEAELEARTKELAGLTHPDKLA